MPEHQELEPRKMFRSCYQSSLAFIFPPPLCCSSSLLPEGAAASESEAL